MTESFDTNDYRSSMNTWKSLCKKPYNFETWEQRETPVHWKSGAKRFIGRTDITDVPTGLSEKVMPLPWTCPRCMTKHLCWVFECVLCGNKSPMGRVNWRR